MSDTPNSFASDDLMQFIQQHEPSLEVEPLTTRSIESLEQFLLFASSIGLFTGIWNIFQLWLSRHQAATIHVSYTAADNTTVEIEMAHRSQKDIDQFIRDHPPKPDNPLLITVKR